jgi:dihydroorotate dehydrogenase
MKEFIIKARNKIIRFFYINFLKPIFFLQDPENIHDRMVGVGICLGRFKFLQKTTSIFFNYRHKSLEQEILGIKFKNPVGLAAGFDKNAELTAILPYVGFGFIEAGSITGKPCAGNPKPRLWRLPKSRSLVVYYGLKNDGAEKISARLKKENFSFPVGISIAKTNSPDTCQFDNGIGDYAKAFENFVDIGDYITVNISCPNTFGGQPFNHPERLEKLLTRLDKIPYKKPVFLKIAADLSPDEIDDILDVVNRHRIHGFVCTNLAKDRNNTDVQKKIKDDNLPDKGGLSGKVVENLSNEVIKYIYKRTKGAYIIIGVGGIFSAQDAYKKIRAGASLLQLITGMIYQGPQVIAEINQGLVGLLKKDGFRNISEAVGAGFNSD